MLHRKQNQGVYLTRTNSVKNPNHGNARILLIDFPFIQSRNQLQLPSHHIDVSQVYWKASPFISLVPQGVQLCGVSNRSVFLKKRPLRIRKKNLRIKKVQYGYRRIVTEHNALPNDTSLRRHFRDKKTKKLLQHHRSSYQLRTNQSRVLFEGQNIHRLLLPLIRQNVPIIKQTLPHVRKHERDPCHQSVPMGSQTHSFRSHELPQTSIIICGFLPMDHPKPQAKSLKIRKKIK